MENFQSFLKSAVCDMLHNTIPKDLSKSMNLNTSMKFQIDLRFILGILRIETNLCKQLQYFFFSLSRTYFYLKYIFFALLP